MKVILALAISLLAMAGMAQAANEQQEMAQPPVTTQATAGHEGSGVLKAVNAPAGKVQIAHEPIADLQWPAMTMWFALRDPLPPDIKVGDGVRFELRQGEKKQWLIVRIVRK
ncbi:cation efflux system protein CusF precursor [mine drainage metagenome]|uniref:Cation efflux system protein CusF n=1 Tax=mine drainage metagenome TaxID=410659 RepID=A0A1J5T8M4_9ZZZZ